MIETVVVLFTRDLRVHDHPALAEACAGARRVVPLFVLDPAVRPYGRAAFLAESLADLRRSLRGRGGDLVVRRGDTVTETMRLARQVGARAVHVSEDVSALASRRQRRLAEECERARTAFLAFPGVTIVPPGALRPSGGGDHYRVFTPYWRVWAEHGRRRLLDAPREVVLSEGLDAGTLPEPGPGGPFPGGERAARERMNTWLRYDAENYADRRDDLAGDRTSRLSPYLRFGCLSPLELESRRPGDDLVRQLCWRDFFHQVTRAFPGITREDYRPRGHRWRHDEEAARAWREGRTGVPIVDAGMRQLLAEGWMHGRARMVTASFLVRRLGVDWRVGAEHFFSLLLDGDVPDNYGNWQWVAGTGNDTRPNRVVNPLRQARRFDPTGEYVRRHVPELRAVPDGAVHRPWRLPGGVEGYPPPLVTME
ncbi:deoxyribodipyrimidine photo-lyase [Streptosporangium sp. NPDC000239]|uniref:cryptochrome/photolyase family protein n=1 Tax=Streptosporangium sp. NPDC000239 TaxID=3154248 RepID=UPI00333174AC